MSRMLAAVLLLGAACAARGPSQGSTPADEMMVERYGPPNRVEEDRLVWEDRGPWRRIAVWAEPGSLDDGAAGRSIESSIAYPVPADKRKALASFSGALRVSAGGDELSARSASEERNVLMLNLADGIVKGRLSVEDARAGYLRALQLDAAGKSQPAMRRLLFR
jgi:hypothetical protein